MLAWTIYISFLGALAVLLTRRWPGLCRGVALSTAIAGLLIDLDAAWRYQPGTLWTVIDLRWVPMLGLRYHLAADGISIVLLLLTGLAAVCGILFSWNVERQTAEFFALYLTLIGGVYGVFLSFDAFLLFVFYEIAIIPKYFLIAIWGSTRREYGAMKLALYSFVGSAMVLVGLIAAYALAGSRTMDLVQLAQFHFPVQFQMWAFPLVFVGFAILAGLWPFHTWAPTGHVAAPTAASMLLAGVVMKLGAYGCLRVAMMLFPLGLAPWGFHILGFGSWRDVFAVLALIGIVYGAAVALVQKDLKFVIGYSSVSHMGFVLLGLMTLSTIGVDGAVLQMFSHGIIAGLLFAVVGRMVYDRTHTRDLATLEGMHLARWLPFAAVIFVLAAMASIGMPGFSGFIAEFQVILGAWQAFPALAVLTGLGILIGMAFTWRALQKTFFGDAAAPRAVGAAAAVSGATGVADPRPHEAGQLQPITLPERLGALLLLAASLTVGLDPNLLVRFILPTLHAPWLAGLHLGN